VEKGSQHIIISKIDGMGHMLDTGQYAPTNVLYSNPAEMTTNTGIGTIPSILSNLFP